MEACPCNFAANLAYIRLNLAVILSEFVYVHIMHYSVHLVYSYIAKGHSLAAKFNLSSQNKWVYHDQI